MELIDCPVGDGGECRIPDSTVLLRNGSPSIVSSAEAHESLSTPVEELGPVVELPHGADEKLREFAADEELNPADRPEQVPSEVFTLDEGVLVTCSCGHSWIYGSEEDRAMSAPS